jgi:hypothetical protein
MLRQRLQVLNIFGVVLHQRNVVSNLGRDEDVIIGVLVFVKLAIYEEAFNIVMPGTAGVAGVIDAWLEIGSRASTTRCEISNLPLGETRSFFKADDIVFLPLIAVYITFKVAITADDVGTVGEGEHTLLSVILGKTSKFSL